MALRFRPCGSPHPPQPTDLCEPNLNLLAHAQAIELDIGSRCGGHGICGGDRVQIPRHEQAKFSAVTEIEQRHLSPAEIADGWRLACQCFPDRSDLETEIGYDKTD